MGSKTLRVCLAMGGGVALGSYSGAGLTEALKLLTIYGKDSKGKLYDKVIVDGMSGASAGAISLGILLRCLVDYKSMQKKVDYNTQEQILQDIADDYYNGKISSIPSEKVEQLCALQVAQKIQHKLWVEKVTSEKLFGEKAKKKGQNFEEPFGLLDRKVLESLTKKYILPSEDFDSNSPQVLDEKRVIFACSLTNLCPMPVGYDSVGNTTEKKNLLRSIASHKHAEVRVIDFVFNEQKDKPTDDRWLKFAKSTATKDGKFQFFDIDSKESWSVLVASSLACGAFPIAFPPVVLKRYKSEYDSSIKNTDPGKSWKNGWPGSLLKIMESINNSNGQLKENSFFSEVKDENKMNYETFNFPYIDGGTFNNEPIKEAFRIASFQDYNRDTSNEERLVLFVDPIVRKDEFKPFTVSSFSPVQTDFEDSETSTKGELGKLFGVVGSILGALINQGSIKEEQKIGNISQRLEFRKELFDYLDNVTIQSDPGLIGTAYKQIESYLNENMISIGTRDPQDYIWSFIRDEFKISEFKNISNVSTLMATMRVQGNNSKKTSSKVSKTAFLNTITSLDKNIRESSHSEDKDSIARAVFKVVANLALQTAGKNNEIDKRAILPVALDLNNESKIIDLPGAEIEAFAGFASLNSKEYAFEYARLNTAKTLMLKNQGRAYLSKTEGDLLVANSQIRLRKTKFYHPNNNYPETLQKKLFVPSVDRLIFIFSKGIRIIAKTPAFLLGIGGAILAPLAGLLYIFKGSPRTQLLKRTKKMAEDTAFYPLQQVTIRIISDNPIRTFARKKIKYSQANNRGRKLKVYKSNDQKKLLFRLSILKNDNSQNRDFPHIALCASSKVKLPIVDATGKAIDPNLDPHEWRVNLEKNYPPKITKLQLSRRGNVIPLDFLTDKAQTLYHSLIYLKFHVNPILEYNIDKETWSFIENTESLDKTILK